MRQDQLILELIDLINGVWLRNHMDLRIMNYKVLATSVNTGLVQYVPPSPLSIVLENYNGDLRAYLSHLSSLNEPLVDDQILENYIRSSAGYSVITYVLGVGDRHLENLLLTDSGHLFHVDYTYVFGRDPKPFPPPMKLCKEMVQAMSGTPIDFSSGIQPVEFQKFKRFCFTAFQILRRNARELLTCVALLVHSGTADLSMLATPSDISGISSLEPGLRISKAVLFVQSRLMLDVGEEEALRRFDQLIDESYRTLPSSHGNHSQVGSELEKLIKKVAYLFGTITDQQEFQLRFIVKAGHIKEGLAILNDSCIQNSINEQSFQ